jgi:hypothetical protein
MDPGKPGQKARSYLQNNQSKKVGSVGSSTCLANTKSLEFKPQYCQKKKKKKIDQCWKIFFSQVELTYLQFKTQV